MLDQLGNQPQYGQLSPAAAQAKDHTDHQDQQSRKEYIESLEREVSLKRILEQNLRDLQSQYYEAVKGLDDYKGTADAKIEGLETKLTEVKNRLESVQNELSDANERADQSEKQLNDTKESSQLLEKKYHRAKRIIKDMQSREDSFTRREQLYQQKLDEIEFELGVLVQSIDRTILDDGLKFYNIIDNSSCPRQHQARLDVFGLIRTIMNNFSSNETTQNAQIKQRIVSILEQQLASLLTQTNGTSPVTDSITTMPPVTAATLSLTNNANAGDSTTAATINQPQIQNNIMDSNSHSQSYQLASHRLSQPNLPHPIGVGGQPTKFFHGLNPMPISVSMNEPSPPQSVNSHSSSNSLNSLNNNNNNNNINNHVVSTKIRTEYSGDMLSNSVTQPSSTSDNDGFQPVPDIQMPFQSNEWHNKPVSEWTTNQVSTWLLALGLDQYISKFEDRNVNGQSLINLDSTVLKGLGVLNSNDRNLLKKKIRELRVEMEKERKLIEKKLKENLKDKSKVQIPNQSGKPSWKKSLLP